MLLPAFVLLFGVLLCVLAILFLLGFRRVVFPKTILPFAGFLLLGVAFFSALRVGVKGNMLWGLGFEEGTVGFLFLFTLTIFAASFTPRRYIPAILHAFVGVAVLSVFVAFVVFVFSPSLFDSALFAGSWPQYAFLYEGSLLTALLLLKDTKFLRARVLLGVAAVVLTAGLFLIFGPYASSHLLLRPDIRPSPYLTTLVVGEEYLQSLPTILLGTGPNTFLQVWERNRPPELNKSAFGDADFNFGYSSAATLLVTLGALGFVALLLSFFAPVILLGKAIPRIFRTIPPGAFASAGLALFCLATILFAVPGSAIVLLGAMAAGFSSVFLGEPVSLRVGKGFARGILLAVPLLILGVPLIFLSYQQLRAAQAHARGEQLLLEGKPETAAPLLLQAADIWGNSVYERDASRGALEAALAELARAPGGEIPKTGTFTSNIDKAIEAGERAVRSNPRDWKAWLAQASLYLALLKIEVGGVGAEDFAPKIQAALAQAYQLSPTRPEISYLYANFALMAGERARAQEYLIQALALKPNYEQAQTLLAQLQGNQ